MGQIKFGRGTPTQYSNLATKDSNEVYFVNDSSSPKDNKIYLGDKLMSTMDIASLYSGSAKGTLYYSNGSGNQLASLVFSSEDSGRFLTVDSNGVLDWELPNMTFVQTAVSDANYYPLAMKYTTYTGNPRYIEYGRFSETANGSDDGYLSANGKGDVRTRSLTALYDVSASGGVRSRVFLSTSGYISADGDLSVLGNATIGDYGTAGVSIDGGNVYADGSLFGFLADTDGTTEPYFILSSVNHPIISNNTIDQTVAGDDTRPLTAANTMSLISSSVSSAQSDWIIDSVSDPRCVLNKPCVYSGASGSSGLDSVVINRTVSVGDSFGNGSVSENKGTAQGMYSHAEGEGTRATNRGEHAEGVFNLSNTGQTNADKTISSIGIGSANNSRENALEVMLNGDIYVYGVGGYDGTNPSTSTTLQDSLSDMVSLTYSELVYKVNHSELIPGMQYRITDYTCTTTQTDTQSAGHVFDIIVTADSENELNENARAAHHSGDTYFANCDLDSWEIKYCLDNDTNRFAWADANSNNGKGVVYWMKDEFGNECPYDFKNIQFKRKLTNGALDDQGTATWCYTFNAYNFVMGVCEDSSTIVSNRSVTNLNVCCENRIESYLATQSTQSKFKLNDIVFLDISYDTMLLVLCYGNTIGSNCYNITFGSSCFGNSFGSNCYSNTFGNSFSNNSFGNNCYQNSFGSSCYQNSFGSSCYQNSFGNNCYQNSFGSSCYQNSFGSNCRQNSFGNSCIYNSFGNSCQNNSFGNDCHHDTFGNYCQTITVFDSVQYCNVTGSTSPSSPVENAQILNGTKGTSSSNRTITFTANQDYTQVAGLVNGTDLRIWVAEDTVTGPQTAVAGHIAVFTGTDSQSGKQIIDSGVSVEDLTPDLVTPITYSSLVTLKNGGNLVPGMQYRITDYECTTTTLNTKAINHKFDIIVTADSVSSLNEVARAAKNSSDTYFGHCDLEAWELKYCLDNDTSRFAWADTTNGKGVVYYMKDEWGNEAPYDFKNIQFKRWALTACSTCPDLVVNNTNNPNGIYYGAKDLDGNNIVDGATYGTDTEWFYTFSLKDVATGTIYDYSVENSRELIGDSNTVFTCHDNSIGRTLRTIEYDGDKYSVCILNNIVFIDAIANISSATNTGLQSCVFNTLDNNCSDSTFGPGCQNSKFLSDSTGNTAGDLFNGNTFGSYCQGNKFGYEFQINTAGNFFMYNTFGQHSVGNSFGNYCYLNTASNDFETNILGNFCHDNTFGGNCSSATFGSDCHHNTFGGHCSFDTFESDFHHNTIGDYLFSSSFGNECSYVTCQDNCGGLGFGDHCTHITLSNAYTKDLIVENGNKYITLTAASGLTPTNSLPLRNITIAQGVNNTTTNKTITHNTIGDTFRTVYQPINSQVISV